MLRNDDIYCSRDASVSQLVAIMMELKYFDQQFLYYGMAYVCDGIIQYRLNENPLPIYQFYAQSAQQGLCPTGITTHVQLIKVPSGHEAATAAKVRDAFITQLKADYPKALFQALEQLNTIAATDIAWETLNEWHDQLELCFDADQIQLFLGLCQMAYEAKILTHTAYTTLKSWAQQRAAQIANCENVIWRDKRYFYGFLYWKNDEKRIYCNTYLPIVMDRAYQLKAQGVSCTPILSKHYWFDAQKSWSIMNWRSKFEADLWQLFDANYLSRFQAIRTLSTPIQPQTFAAAFSALDTARFAEASKVLNYYRNRWLFD